MDGSQTKLERDLLGFHEICGRYGISPRTLRYYESLEILSPEISGRQRCYDARQQVRLELTLRARRFRIPLEQARQLLELYDFSGPERQAEAWRHTVIRQRERIAAEIRDLQTVWREMDDIVKEQEKTP